MKPLKVEITKFEKEGQIITVKISNPNKTALYISRRLFVQIYGYTFRYEDGKVPDEVRRVCRRPPPPKTTSGFWMKLEAESTIERTIHLSSRYEFKKFGVKAVISFDGKGEVEFLDENSYKNRFEENNPSTKEGLIEVESNDLYVEI